FAGIASLRQGVRQARWFLIAWSVMIIGGIVFSLRGWGWLPQNNLTIHMLLISAVVESILLSVALADRIRLLQMEKEAALGLYKEAEASSKAHEIAFLQAQIKPHFLNNVLNVIAALCRLDAEKARELILNLSSYLQHTFAFNNLSRYIPFEDELEFIQAYVSIEKARFRDKLRVEYELEDTGDLRLPPLILQPLVENAIRHGLRKSVQGGTIVLRVKNEKERFVIQVEDNGAGMTGEQLDKIMAGKWEYGTGVGIANINRRLLEMYGTGLDIKSIPGEGTTVTMVIPREKGESNESRTYR
ncbi:MAG: histidine kinase, partial [Syntrophomonadaceae bacterium]|nr:histidine kinase [Syntrophomonadaceae bacterium]